MYKLSSTDKIQVVLGAAVAANQSPITGTYADLSDTGFPISALTAILSATNSTTAVDVVASPSAGTSRVLKSLTIYNKDTTNINVTVQQVGSGPTTREQIVKDLAPGDVLHYEDGNGWTVHRKREGTVADGQVANAEGTIYTSTGIKFVKAYFFNTNAATQTLILWIKRSGGTARKIRQATLQQNDSYVVDKIRLSPGDILEASTTTATAVDYVVSRDPIMEE